MTTPTTFGTFSSAFSYFYFALLNASGSYLNTFSIRAAAVITQSCGGKGGPTSRLSFASVYGENGWGDFPFFCWPYLRFSFFSASFFLRFFVVLCTSSIFYNKVKFQEEEYKNVQPKLSRGRRKVGFAAYWSVLIRLGISLKEREICSIKTEGGPGAKNIIFVITRLLHFLSDKPDLNLYCCSWWRADVNGSLSAFEQ